MAPIVLGHWYVGETWSSPVMASGSEADIKTAESPYRRRKRLAGRGSERNDLSGGNIRDRRERSSPEFDLHGCEEGLRQEETRDKSQVGERAPPHGALQNVDDERCQGIFTGRQLYYHSKLPTVHCVI